ncbi:hypothetical protein K438DRAFT_1936305 [Mycena galopus ATCC 62051]|nr:hypothetical protein K438DRAFT_1936305 [Mycena galopus ATCC 62051]
MPPLRSGIGVYPTKAMIYWTIVGDNQTEVEFVENIIMPTKNQSTILCRNAKFMAISPGARENTPLICETNNPLVVRGDGWCQIQKKVKESRLRRSQGESTKYSSSGRTQNSDDPKLQLQTQLARNRKEGCSKGNLVVIEGAHMRNEGNFSCLKKGKWTFYVSRKFRHYVFSRPGNNRFGLRRVRHQPRSIPACGE